MKYVLFATALLSVFLLGSRKDVVEQSFERLNLLDNAGAENNRAKMTASTPAHLSIDTSTPIRGNASFVWNPASASDTLETDKYAVPDELQGQPCSVVFTYEFTVAGSSPVSYVVKDDGGADLFTAVNVTSSIGKRTVKRSFTCPVDSVQIVWTAAGDEPGMKLDNMWLGAPTSDFQTPSGTILPFAGGTIPAGYLLCDGSTYDSVANPEYGELFAALATTWGGTGATSFQVPDFRGRHLKGAGTIGDGNGGDQVTLGAFQDDTTSKNGLELGGQTAVAASGHTHGKGSLVANIAVETSVDTITLLPDVTNPESSGTYTRYAGLGSVTTSSILNPSISGTSINGNTGASISNGTVTLGAGDAETRPKSYGVNYIIKI